MQRQLKVLELFAGTRSIGRAFEERGHLVYSVDWSEKFDGIDLCADIMQVEASDILEAFGRRDVIWASPDCSSYGVAAIGHHRKKNATTGELMPVTDYAAFSDRLNMHLHGLIMALSPRLWFIENPRGGDAQNVVYERPPPLHGHVLPVWRAAHEAYGHLD